MKDKILKQIKDEAVKFSKSNYADSIPNKYIEELSFIAGAKYGYNIKESVDEKLVEALKEVWKHMNAYIPEKVFDLVEEALISASQNTEKHICEPMVNANWTKLQCNCGKEFSVGENTVSNEGEKLTNCNHPYNSVRKDKITELCTCADCGKEFY